MKWKWCSRVTVALCAAALCVSTYGDIVLEEHGEYQEGPSGDYYVTWNQGLPQITILEPSNAQDGPYDFECYDDSTSTPYDPATILWIKAEPNIGNVEIKVVGHADRTFGALHLRELHLDQTGVNSTIEELNIRGELGEDGETHLDQISGSFLFDKLVTDMYVDTLAQGTNFRTVYTNADLYVTGAGPHQGDIDLGYLYYPRVVEITGTMGGSITAGKA